MVRQAADYFVTARGRRRPGRGAGHAGPAAPLHRRVLRLALLGRAGAFSAEDVDLTEPFGDAEHFRASIANYE